MRIDVLLDTAGLEYGYTDLAVTGPGLAPTVFGPLTYRCGTVTCLRNGARFHSAGNLRFIVNAAGPLFLYDALDAGIVWPSTTPNSYASIGAGTITGVSGGQPVALGPFNIGQGLNYWAGLPVPTADPVDPFVSIVRSWVVPTVGNRVTIRGIEITHTVTVRAALPDVIVVDVLYRNVTADSLYRALDPIVPAEGITYEDAWIGFVFDPDVGAFDESDDDLASYSAERNLVFVYDAHMLVPGFSGGASSRPGLVGLMMLAGPGPQTRLNAWPRAENWFSGHDEVKGRALLTAQQAFLPNHPDGRIGYAPDVTTADYTVSVASGPITLAPGQQASARFAVLLAAPADSAFVSGTLLPAGDPLDEARPLAAAADRLLRLADEVAGIPELGSAP